MTFIRIVSCSKCHMRSWSYRNGRNRPMRINLPVLIAADVRIAFGRALNILYEALFLMVKCETRYGVPMLRDRKSKSIDFRRELHLALRRAGPDSSVKCPVFDQ